MNCNFIVYDPDLLASFRQSCMNGDDVVCDWECLKTWLESHVVSDIWWLLTRNERYSIASITIANNLFLGYSPIVCTGEPYCGGANDCYTGSCASAALVRYTKLGVPVEIVDYVGPEPTGNIDGCYFKFGHDGIPQCTRQPNPYCLPCHFVQGLNESAGRWHIICGIQIVNSFDNLDNWILFQYSNIDIKPGDPQLPLDCVATIYTTERIGCFGLDSRSDGAIILAEFQI